MDFRKSVVKAKAAIKTLQGDNVDLVGVDIGSSSIKVLELEFENGTYNVVSYAMLPIAEGVVSDGRIESEKDAVMYLKRAFKQSGSKKREIVMSVSGSSVIVKTITVPVMSEFELVKQIQFEASPHMPYDVSDVYIDFNIVGQNSEDSGLMDVMVVAARKDIIDNMSNIAKQAGLTLSCVDHSVFALENAVSTMTPYVLQTIGSYAIIDIGYSLLTFNVMHNGESTFTRSDQFGTSELVNQVAELHSISTEKASNLCINHSDKVDKDDFFDMLSERINALIDFYMASGFIESPIVKVYLSGGGSMVDGITPALNERLPDIHVEKLDPSSMFVCDSQEKQAYFDDIGSSIMQLMGLAIRRFYN